MSEQTKFIMEIGSNHNKNLDRLDLLLKEAKELEFWGIKLQLFDPDKLYFNPSIKKINELEKQALPVDWLPYIKQKCQENNLKFICTPFYIEAVGLLREFVDCYKISSFDTGRKDLIDKCLQTNKKVFISNGLIAPIELFVLMREFLDKYDNINNIIPMYCISNYPASYFDFYEKELDYIRLYGTKEIGYSDHTVDQGAIVKAIIHDVNYIEIHYDLMDGRGLEAKHGHCWNREKIEKLYDNNNNIFQIEECSVNFKKNFSRADPGDGLRPMKEIRN